MLALNSSGANFLVNEEGNCDSNVLLRTNLRSRQSDVPQPLMKTGPEGLGITCGNGRRIMPQKRVHEDMII